MGGEQRGDALGPDDGPDQAHDLLAGLGVQLPGGLVGKQQPGAISFIEAACSSPVLPLPARCTASGRACPANTASVAATAPATS